MTATPTTPALLSIPEASTYLGVSERFLRRLVSERRITIVKLGKLVRMRRSDLDAYIAASTREAVTR